LYKQYNNSISKDTRTFYNEMSGKTNILHILDIHVYIGQYDLIKSSSKFGKSCVTHKV